jgi:Fis family transcriptional regulator, factor for inversion stimulation protein
MNLTPPDDRHPGGSDDSADRRRLKAEESAVPRIDDTIRKALDQYFKTLGDQTPHALYEMVVSAAERPLLAYVMQRYGDNVSHAAKALGITRNTLRKKLQAHGLSPETKNPAQSRSPR